MDAVVSSAADRRPLGLESSRAPDTGSDRPRVGEHLVVGARSSVYAALVTVLLAVVGVVGSVFSTEIGSAFPFLWPWLNVRSEFPWISFPYDGWSPVATLFWTVLIATGVTFGVRQWAVDLARQENQARADEAVQRLEHLIRTVPSADFLARFWDIYLICDAALEGALRPEDGAPDREILNTAARQILRGFALLAWEYDGRPGPDVNYAANVMLYRAREEVPEAEWPSVRERMRFDPSVDWDDLRGVLDLQRDDLSTTAFSDEAAPDETLIPLALPIWKRESVTLPPDYRRKWRLFPGAPIAFVLDEASHFVDAKDLLAWCTENGLFTEDAILSVAEYFRPDDGPPVGSFISLPLKGPDDEAEPIAVLNLHRSESGLLKEAEGAAEHFVPVVRPLQLMLGKLLWEVRHLSTDVPPTGDTTDLARRD